MSWLFRSSKSRQGSPAFNEDSDLSADIVFDRDPPLYILHPAAKRPGSQAPKTTSVSGKFNLRVKTEQHVIAVVAKLVPSYSFKHGKMLDEGTCSPLTCQIIDTECTFTPGVVPLAFAFEIPCDFWSCSSTTSNPLDEAEYSDVVGGTAFSPRFLTWYAWELHIIRRQTASGHNSNGSSGVSLEVNEPEIIVVHVPPRQELHRSLEQPGAWKEMYHLRFFALVSTSADPGELPPPMEVAVEDHTPQLGPMRIVISSRSLSVGALLNFKVELLATPSRYILKEIKGYIEQTSTWKSLRAKGPKYECKYGMRFMTLGEKDFIQSRHQAEDKDEPSSNSTYALSAQASVDLPDDRFLNPSNVAETISPLTCSHFLIFRFEVIDTTELTKVVVEVKRPIFLESCMLIPELFDLPRYGSDPIPMEAFQPCRPHARFACACGFSVELLQEREGTEVPLFEDVSVEDASLSGSKVT